GGLQANAIPSKRLPASICAKSRPPPERACTQEIKLADDAAPNSGQRAPGFAHRYFAASHRSGHHGSDASAGDATGCLVAGACRFGAKAGRSAAADLRLECARPPAAAAANDQIQRAPRQRTAWSALQPASRLEELAKGSAPERAQRARARRNRTAGAQR